MLRLPVSKNNRHYETRENVFPDEIVNEMTERLRDDGQIVLAESAALFVSEGILVKQKFVEATDTAQTLIGEAEGGCYDLVIIGNSGSLEDEIDLHLGSIVKNCLSVKAPILVNRKKKEIKKILVPIDSSPRDEIVLRNSHNS